MSIKIIVCDLDGTLLHSDKSLSPQTLLAIQRCQQQGFLFGFATARSPRSAKRLLDQIKPDFAVLNDGALVLLKEQVLHSQPIALTTANALIETCKQLPDVDEITLVGPHASLTNSARILSWGSDYDHFLQTSFEKPLDTAPYKITISCPNIQTIENLKQQFSDLDVVCYSGENWYRFAQKSTSKLSGLRVLAAHLGFSLQEIVAFGDDNNDIEMLHACGTSIAMQNAIPAAKAAAQFVCPSNDADGVAQWLEHHILDD